MKNVIIKNRQGIQTHGARLENPAEWITQGIAANWWGKPERWVREGDEDITAAIETREVEITPAILDDEGQEITPAETVTEYKLAAEYTIEVEDITAEIEAEKAKEQEKAQADERLAKADVRAKIAAATTIAQLKTVLLEVLPDLVITRK
jgi:archaellum component FlaD/FlaE